MRDALEGFLALILVLGFIGAFIAGLIYVCTSFCAYRCYKTAEIYQIEAKYNWASGCFFKQEGRYMPQAEYEKLLTPNYQMGNGEIKVKIQD